MKIVPLTKHIRLKRQKHIQNVALLTLLLAGLFVSCHDKTPDVVESNCNDNPGLCQNVLQAKDFFVFKVGSYWVYEEETSHERDSMYVTDYYNSSSYDFDVRMKSSLTDYEYHYWPTYTQAVSGCTTSGPVSRKCIYINRSKGKFQDNLGESQVFFIKYKVGDYETSGSDMDYCPNNHVTIGAILDSFTVGANNFTNVVRIDQNCEFAEGKQPTKFYYSKNTGIIRKELIDSNQVWNLVNYHVIQ